MTITGPRKWCDPDNAFGQLMVGRKPVTKRVWLPPNPNDPFATADFRAAVMQNVVCLWVRTAKNSLPHPTTPGHTFPLSAFVALDKRSPVNDTERWQGKLTGRYNLTPEDLVTIMEILPGAMPSEADIKVFLDVAQKRIQPPSGWGWPDT